MMRLFGRRVMLRPLVGSDFAQWSEVRMRNQEWLLKWEPMRIAGVPDPSNDREAFAVRCSARARTSARSWIRLRHLRRRPVRRRDQSELDEAPRFQNAYVGYWIDEAHAGNGYTPNLSS